MLAWWLQGTWGAARVHNTLCKIGMRCQPVRGLAPCPSLALAPKSYRLVLHFIFHPG